MKSCQSTFSHNVQSLLLLASSAGERDLKWFTFNGSEHSAQLAVKSEKEGGALCVWHGWVLAHCQIPPN